MDKFKVGDRVRRVNGRDHSAGIKVGDVGTVSTVMHGWFGLVEFPSKSDETPFSEGNFEHWRPKVGERVRTQDRGYEGRSSEGVVKRTDEDGALIEYADGWAFGHDGDLGDKVVSRWWHSVDNLEPLPVAAQAQPAADATAAALKIEAGKYYRTRDGRKVGPMKYHMLDSKGVDRWIVVEGNGEVWFADGKWANAIHVGSDLVAEWAEPAPATPARVNVAATVDAIDEEYGAPAKPKFKVGDVVVGRGPFGTEFRGKITEVDNSDDWLTYRVDDKAWLTKSSVQHVSAPTAIVALIENGQPKPATRPYVHATQASAEAEANRLANKHKGKAFGVYVLAGEPALVEPKLRVGDSVKLAAPVRVTGFVKGKANIVTTDGGSFVLPVSALAAA